jgi:hypothetical protein
VKKEKNELPEYDYVDYVYAGSSKAKAELKIFNPELHNENHLLRQKY